MTDCIKEWCGPRMTRRWYHGSYNAVPELHWRGESKERGNRVEWIPNSGGLGPGREIELGLAALVVSLDWQGGVGNRLMRPWRLDLLITTRLPLGELFILDMGYRRLLVQCISLSAGRWGWRVNGMKERMRRFVRWGLEVGVCLGNSPN